jgi:deoxyadenosine/deoxycytidine kinase
MNSIQIFLLCPVPEEQKPIHEYILLKDKLEVSSKEEKEKKRSFISQFFKNVGRTFLLFRWFFLSKRFCSPHVIYEEASWYDGQIWEKPLSFIKNDHFINTQKIQPNLKKKTFSLIVSSFLILSFFYSFHLIGN